MARSAIAGARAAFHHFEQASEVMLDREHQLEQSRLQGRPDQLRPRTDPSAWRNPAFGAMMIVTGDGLLAHHSTNLWEYCGLPNWSNRVRPCSKGWETTPPVALRGGPLAVADRPCGTPVRARPAGRRASVRLRDPHGECRHRAELERHDPDGERAIATVRPMIARIGRAGRRRNCARCPPGNSRAFSVSTASWSTSSIQTAAERSSPRREKRDRAVPVAALSAFGHARTGPRTVSSQPVSPD